MRFVSLVAVTLRHFDCLLVLVAAPDGRATADSLTRVGMQFKLYDDEANCVLDCPKKTGNCVNQTCCGPQQGKESQGSSPNLVKRSKANSQSELNSTNEFVEVAVGDREKSRSAEDMV